MSVLPCAIPDAKLQFEIVQNYSIKKYMIANVILNVNAFPKIVLTPAKKI